MLVLTIPGEEFFDDEKQRFFTVNDITLEMEHSLVSLSKWEEKWEKPFLSDDKKTEEQVLHYFMCMMVTPNVPPEIFLKFTTDHYKQINDYIDAKMSATWFAEKMDTPKGPKRKEIITAEIIYYWMDTMAIPMEWESRHLGRLFTLIKVHNEKNQPEKKVDKKALMERNRRLNEERLAKLGTTG
ncbi:hypothetical protein PBI_SPORTO_18 [Arthrobacter phage Sporto]|nr:hypothetical protein PBI_SPORTO_18 [Arthrobacter phage Sporto]